MTNPPAEAIARAQLRDDAARARDRRELESGRWYGVSFGLHGTPPSLNKVGGRGVARFAWAREKKTWQASLEKMLMHAGARFPRGMADKALASAVLTFARRARRDEGNYRSLLEKALGDALVNGRWLPDDTPDHFRFVDLNFARQPGAAQTLVLIRWRCR